MISLRTALLGLGAAAAIGSSVFLAACGDDDSGSGSGNSSTTSPSKGGSAKVDVSKADALAHQAMLVEQDLPGSGWSVTKTDKFDDATSTPDTPACKAVDALKKQATTKSDPDRAGRAEKEITRTGNSPVPLNVELEVNVFKSTSSPADTLALFRKALEGTDYETCLKDGINAEAAGTPGLKVDAKKGTPSASAPQGGVAAAYDISVSAAGQSINVHAEVYAWVYSNTGNTLSVFGATTDATPDLVKAALSKADTKVQALGK